MKVYIAAPWVEKDGLARDAFDKFTAAGFDVTSRWILRDVGEPPYEEAMLGQEAIDDLDDIADSDVLVLLNCQPRGAESSGKQVEFGYAIEMCQLVLVGEPTNVFHRLPGVIRVSTVEEAIEQLRG